MTDNFAIRLPDRRLVKARAEDVKIEERINPATGKTWGWKIVLKGTGKLRSDVTT